MDTAKTLLAASDFDLALVDPWFENKAFVNLEDAKAANPEVGMIMAWFDKAPIAARMLQRGIELLRVIQENPDSFKAWLLNLVMPMEKLVDDELLVSAERYGVKGTIDLKYEMAGYPFQKGFSFKTEDLADFRQRLQQVVLRIRRERSVAEIGGQGKVLAFDTAPAVLKQGKEILIRLRGLRLITSPSVDNARGLISDAERPVMGFEDVFGADQAKVELRHIVDWLR